MKTPSTAAIALSATPKYHETFGTTIKAATMRRACWKSPRRAVGYLMERYAAMRQAEGATEAQITSEISVTSFEAIAREIGAIE